MRVFCYSAPPPDSNGFVPGPGGEPQAGGAPGDGPHGVGVPRKSDQLTARGDVPDARRGVARRGGEAGAVGAPRALEHAGVVPLDVAAQVEIETQFEGSISYYSFKR